MKLKLTAIGNSAGVIGVRGDVRLAGKFLDGLGGTNAQAGFIPQADLTVDTGDSSYFGNSTNNYRALRNMLMHEIGHSFGLGHVDSNSAAFLMEGFSNNSFEGPQLAAFKAKLKQIQAIPVKELPASAANLAS